MTQPQPRPFRFGAAGDEARSGAEWRAQVRRAEEFGYAVFVMPDHFVTALPPIAALMAAADAAPRIRIGTTVFDNDFRHPALLAKEVAALDLLSDGRFELGIGAGWHQAEYDQIGLPFEAATLRIERLAEALAILKQFFTQESVTFAGKHYHVTGLEALPKPAQRPHPPIFIGGGGKRLLTLAGQQADIIGLHFKVNADGTVDLEERTEMALARKIAWVRAAAGERFAAIELNLLVSAVIITDDRQRAAEERVVELNAREGTTTTNTAAGLLANPYWLIGSVEQIAEQLRQLRQTHGISYIAIRSDAVETFAPVVARLAGT
jgi:probable F420-dependent oxidoreductase